MLAVAGRLNAKTGGPRVIIPVDPELVNLRYEPAQWAVNEEQADHDRRSIYLLHKRNLRVPMMEVFDVPDMRTPNERRLRERRGQALRRAPGPRGQADPGAGGIGVPFGGGRAPTAKEVAIGAAFLRSRPLSELALVVLNLNAFLYVN